VIRSPAGLDPDKLISFQSHWMSQLSAAEKLDGCLSFLKAAGLIKTGDDPETRAYVAEVVDLTADRLRVFGDIFQVDEFFVADESLSIDAKNFEKRVSKSEATRQNLGLLKLQLQSIPEFLAGPLHDLLQAFTTERAIKAGDIFPALRLCVTGKAQGADLFRSLELLGRERVIRRLEQSLSRAAETGNAGTGTQP
jgi:glutamyl-tRNA synthetase